VLCKNKNLLEEKENFKLSPENRMLVPLRVSFQTFRLAPLSFYMEIPHGLTPLTRVITNDNESHH